jgi:hypothetical protein
VLSEAPLFLLHVITCAQGLEWYQKILIRASVAFLLMLFFLLLLFLIRHWHHGKGRKSGE